MNMKNEIAIFTPMANESKKFYLFIKSLKFHINL